MTRRLLMTFSTAGRWLWPFVALVILPVAAHAAGPVALVESVTGSPSGVELMDYLSEGQEISLGPSESVVIDYLRSCLRETISSGTITIGAERSAVKGGTLESERVRCDGALLMLSPEQSSASAGAVFRVPPKSHPLPPGTVIQRRLYGASPIVDLGGGNRLVIERLDRKEDRLDFVLPIGRLTRGRFFDFADDSRTLSPGGVYRATAGQNSVVFQIDRSAKPGRTPILGRLLHF